MANRGLLLALAVALAAPSAAWAMLADIPLPVLARESELIVVGEAVEAGAAAKLTLDVPGMKKPLTTWFRKYVVKVTRVITEDGRPPAAKAAKPADRTIQIFARSPAPRQPGQLRLFVSDAYYASLAVGKPYVLILRTMPGKPEYFLTGYPKNYRPAKPDQIARVETAALVDRWPWGRPVGGLQVALIPRRTTAYLQQVRRAVRGNDGRMRTELQGPSASVRCMLALRNASKAPLAVNLYPPDKFLSIVAAGPGGKTVRPDLYRFLVRADFAQFSPKNAVVLAAGETVFFNAMGKGNYDFAVNLDVPAGTWTLRASYTSKRAATAGKCKLWTGTAKAAAADIEVKKQRQ